MANRDELNAQALDAGIQDPAQYETKADLQAAIDKATAEPVQPGSNDSDKSVEDQIKDEADETTPAEQAAEDIEKSGIQNTDVDGSTVNEDAGEGEPDAKSDGSNREDQTVAAQANGVDGVDRDHTPAGTTAEANSETEAADRIQPPVAANGLSSEASDEAYNANNSTVPGETASETKERELKETAEKEASRKAEAKAVETELGSSEEEAAAARAGVQDERLNDPVNNREPKNQFEQSNQKVTEEERQAAQEVSDMTTADRESEAPSPNEAAAVDAERSAATNQGNQIAEAIAQGFKKATNGKDDFELQPEEGIDPRFSLVRNKQTGDVMLRDNSDGTLSQIQLKSLEEKEGDLQNTEVEEL